MKGKYKTHDAMSELISDDYRMMQLISRFGITLGFGEQDISTVCRSHDVDPATFLAVVNYVKDAGHTHINELAEQASLPTLMLYLRNSHTYFVDFRLPTIRRKLIEATNCSLQNRIPFLIIKFYDEYAHEVAKHMKYEEAHVHPYVENLLQGKLPAPGERFDDVVNVRGGNHASIEKSIGELKNLIIKYCPSETDAFLLNDVLMDIYMTEEDLLIHCHLEDTLFAECVRQLERRLEESQAADTAERGDGNAEDSADGDGLSQREREIIVEVVRGLSNKEIAEKLFISVNTVMTHRRNISRKLQIHSPAALTIYAIVNELVSLDDVKL